MDLKTLTIKKAHELLVSGEITAVTLAEAYLKEINKKNEGLNVYLEVFDDVLEQAKKAQAKVKKGNFLAGIPFAIKDNILIKNRKLTAGSKILEGYVAPYDSTVISKLCGAGAVFLGRTNMDEFAMGSSTENSAFGVTKNPLDVSRVPGGSSGGSAAAIAMDGALASLGSDTGGSVRQPASYCGVVGFKPTYGSVSRHGLIAMGSSLDVIGPIAKTAEDAEIIWDVIKGKDTYDSTSIDISSERPNTNGEKLVIGVPRKFLSQGGVDKEVMEAFERTLENLKNKGYKIKDVDLPNMEYALAVYYVIMPAEASTNLSRFDGVKYGLHKNGSNLLDEYLKTRHEGFGKETRRRIMLGSYVLSSGYYDAYYNKATAVRQLIIEDFEKVFKEVSVIATPTTPSVAFKIGEKTADPVSMYLEDIFTVTANLAYVPAISVPCGFKMTDGINLPIGIQIIGKYGGDKTVLSVGKDIESTSKSA